MKNCPLKIESCLNRVLLRLTNMTVNRKQRQENREALRLKIHKWNKSPAGKLHKKHKEMFGVEPKFFGANYIGSQDYLEKIRDAIKTGIPLDEYEALSPEMKEKWEQGVLEID